jgi:hypothetical protein
VFLAALFPDPDLFVRLYLAYVTTSASSGTGNTRLDLSVTGRAFKADVGRGWTARPNGGGRTRTPCSGNPYGAISVLLVDLDRRHQDATNMLHKVKLILVRF